MTALSFCSTSLPDAVAAGIEGIGKAGGVPDGVADGVPGVGRADCSGLPLPDDPGELSESQPETSEAAINISMVSSAAAFFIRFKAAVHLPLLPTPFSAYILYDFANFVKVDSIKTRFTRIKS